MQKRNILNSPRLLELKKKRQKVFATKVILFVFAFLIIFAGSAYFSRVPVLNISSVEIVGNKVTDAGIIKDIVQKEIEGNYLWFFPKTNVLIYPKNAVKNKLHNEFKIIKDATFAIKDKTTLEISISERESKYTWCGDHMMIEPGNEEKCYFMDENGYIFDKAPYFSGEVYFKFYGSAGIGEYFSKDNKNNFSQLIYFKDTLVAMGLKPVSLNIMNNGDTNIFLSNSNKASERPYITFKTNSDFQKLLGNLETALGVEPLKLDFKNKYSSLIYLDLRFGNKVLYKFH